MRNILGKTPTSTPDVNKRAGACKNQNGHYDWHSHQEVIKRMAFQLCEDVENGTRDSLTFELVEKPTSYDLGFGERRN